MKKRTISKSYELNLSREQLLGLYHFSPDLFLITSLKDNKILACNAALVNKTGYTQEELLKRPVFDLFLREHQSDARKIYRTFKRTLKMENIESVDLCLLKKNGNSLDISVHLTCIYDEQEKVIALQSTLRDISREKFEARKFREVMESSPEAILGISKTGKILMVNKKLETMFGYTKKELLDSCIEKLLPERFRKKYHKELHDFFMENGLQKPACTELAGVRRNGKEFPIDIVINVLKTEDEPLALCHIRDITKEKKSQLTINRLANYDITTKLPNRSFFTKTLAKRIQQASKDKTYFALILINLNRFKFINDYYGHHVGDFILKKFGSRLSKQIRANDFLARLGSDEFVIIMDTTDPHQPNILARRLLCETEVPIQLTDTAVTVSISLGITFYPNGGANEQALLKNADIALAKAKSLKTPQYAFFSYELDHQYASRLFIENNLAMAVKNHELSLVYQPQINLKTQHLVGMEALLRWNNIEIGCISPNIFIPVAENEGFINSIGMWVFENVCKKIQEWKYAGLSNSPVSINISINQLMDTSLADNFVNLCRKYTVDPTSIILEITETSIMSLETRAMETLDQLTRAGFILSIDDFGSGYSSLSRLNQIPVKILKIDKSLTQGSGDNAEKILKAIIKLGNSLELNIIAEGVDTLQKCKFLIEAGCEIGQGFYFYAPMDSDSLTHLLKSKWNK